MPFFHPGEKYPGWKPKKTETFQFFWFRFTKKICSQKFTQFARVQLFLRFEIDFSFFFYRPRKKKKKRKVLSETETFHSRFRDSWVVDKFVYPQRFSSKRLVDDVATSSLSLMGKPFGQRIDLIVAISAAARSSSRRRAIST